MKKKKKGRVGRPKSKNPKTNATIRLYAEDRRFLISRYGSLQAAVDTLILGARLSVSPRKK